MKTLQEFEAFYDRELKATLEQFEKQRLAVANKYSYKRYGRNLKWMAVVSVGLVILSNVFPDLIPEQVVFTVPATVLYAIIAPIYIAIKRGTVFGPVEKEYKRTVVPKVVAFIDPELRYEPESGISADDFYAGGMFDRPTDYRSEDLIRVRSGNQSFRMADITCSRKQTSYRSGSKSNSSYVTVFQGCYAIASHGSRFSTRIVITTTNPVADLLGGLARKLLGNQLIDHLADKLNIPVVRTGDAEFDKAFTVKSEDAEQAKKLLSPVFVHLIKAFYQEAGTPVALSFFDNQFHIGFWGPNLFEIESGTPVTDPKITRQYFRFVTLALGLAGALRST